MWLIMWLHSDSQMFVSRLNHSLAGQQTWGVHSAWVLVLLKPERQTKYYSLAFIHYTAYTVSKCNTLDATGGSVSAFTEIQKHRQRTLISKYILFWTFHLIRLKSQQSNRHRSEWFLLESEQNRKKNWRKEEKTRLKIS